MKKTFIISSLICILTLSMFTACGSSNPSYWEAWNVVEGYMILDDGEGATTRHFEPYSVTITDTKYPATLYTHSYSRSPYTVITIQKWNKETIEYEDYQRETFTISNKPKETKNCIFYKDDESLYILSKLDSNDKVKIHTDRYSNATYRFIIDVDGIYDDIEILLDEKGPFD